MDLKLYLQNSNDGIVYNISDIAETVTVDKSVDGTAGKLTCILQRDPNNTLVIANGSRVSFEVDGTGVFFGYVFTIGTDAEGNYKITCYDQLKYLKNSDIYIFKNMTASDIFDKICNDYSLQHEIRVPTKYVPNAYQFVNKTLYSIIKRGMDLATLNDKQQYYIIDDFGTLVWSSFEHEGEQLSITLGDASLVTSFTYEKSIDNDVYNQVKLYRENKDAGKVDTWIVRDPNNIKRWGLLQYLNSVDDNVNSSQVRSRAEDILNTLNHEKETLKIQAEGVLQCIAGQRLRLVIPRERIDKWMWIKTSSHTFNKYEHTMDLEVEV